MNNISKHIRYLWYWLEEPLQMIGYVLRPRKYTGYEDCNGKRIKMGDTVRFHPHDTASIGQADCKKYCDKVYKVRWSIWGVPVYESHQSISSFHRQIEKLVPNDY